MSIIKHPLYLVLSAIAISIYLSKMANIALPNWMYFYLSDLLCMPLVFSTCLAIIRVLKKDNSIYIPLGAVLVLTIYYSVYFEYFLPQYNERYTADCIDIVMYFLGALLFYGYQKRLF
ncbi:hypothetical protein [Lacinutrix salivirga]